MIAAVAASTVPQRLGVCPWTVHALPSPTCALPIAYRRHSLATCATSSQTQVSTDDQEIKDLDTNYCDDFVCTSSPAVESTVRALARDISRANGVWTKSLLSRAVEYQDPFRRFKGQGGYQRLNFIKKLDKAEVQVKSMRMLNGSTAVIAWQLTGSLGPLPVDIDMETTIEMNLLTGQVEKHTEAWSLQRCSLPASAAWTVARAAWAAQMGGTEVAESTGTLLDNLTSVDSDGEDPGYYSNPEDPMKFFQKNDGFKDDAIFFIGGVAVLYAVVQVYTTLFAS